MEISVRFSGTSLAQYAEKVGQLGQKADIELQRGLNAGGDVVRTNIRRAIKEQTSVVSAKLVGTLVQSVPASVGALRYTIGSSGRGLPIRDFAFMASPGQPVTAIVWGVPITFQRSFMTSKKGLLRARTGEASKPIRALYGPSIAKELVKGQSLKTFEHAVREIVEPIVSARIARLMA